MSHDWYIDELLIKEKHEEIERSAKEAWKWLHPTPQKKTGWSLDWNLFRTRPIPCCTANCC